MSDSDSNETELDIELPDGATESETDRNGFLSYAAEWHSVTHGVYMGLTTRPWRTPPEPAVDDVVKESHYYRGGYVIGTLLQVVIVFCFVRTGVFLA